jgi:hypothetical protein
VLACRRWAPVDLPRPSEVVFWARWLGDFNAHTSITQLTCVLWIAILSQILRTVIGKPAFGEKHLPANSSDPAIERRNQLCLAYFGELPMRCLRAIPAMWDLIQHCERLSQPAESAQGQWAIEACTPSICSCRQTE